ncbi:MAG: hypothetical protein Q9182_005173 [Xanthomendoza sp. 2 TL-2023]
MQLLSSPLLASIFSFLLANTITAFPSNFSNPLNLTNSEPRTRSVVLSRDPLPDNTKCFRVKDRSFPPDVLKSLANELETGDPDNESYLSGGQPESFRKGMMKGCVTGHGVFRITRVLETETVSASEGIIKAMGMRDRRLISS